MARPRESLGRKIVICQQASCGLETRGAGRAIGMPTDINGYRSSFRPLPGIRNAAYSISSVRSRRSIIRSASRFAQIARSLQQGFDFIAAQNHWQLPFAPRKRKAFDGDLPVQGVGIEEARSADHHHVGGCRHLLFLVRNN